MRGQRWSHKRHQLCLANCKKGNNFGILGQFAKKCRKRKKSHVQTSKPQHTNVNQIDTTTTKSDDEESVN